MTQAPPIQTISQGATLADRYKPLGILPGVTTRPELARQFAVVVGFGDEGKSYTMQDIEGGFILNFDGHPITNPNRKAIIWPGVDVDGRMIDADMKPIMLDWDKVLEKKKTLIQMAKENYAGRPKTVIIDTLDTMHSHVKDYIAKCKGKDFEDLGKAGWAYRNQEITQFIYDLRNAGYGVFVCVHLSYKDVQMDTGAKQDMDTPAISGALNPIFTGLPAPIMRICKKAGNKPGEFTYWAKFNDPSMKSGCLKRPKGTEGFPDEIQLPKINPFQALEAAFQKYASKPQESTK